MHHNYEEKLTYFSDYENMLLVFKEMYFKQ